MTRHSLTLVEEGPISGDSGRCMVDWTIFYGRVDCVDLL